MNRMIMKLDDSSH